MFTNKLGASGPLPPTNSRTRPLIIAVVDQNGHDPSKMMDFSEKILRPHPWDLGNRGAVGLTLSDRGRRFRWPSRRWAAPIDHPNIAKVLDAGAPADLAQGKRPSTRLSSPGGQATVLAGNRGTGPTTLPGRSAIGGNRQWAFPAPAD